MPNMPKMPVGEKKKKKQIPDESIRKGYLAGVEDCVCSRIATGIPRPVARELDWDL